MTALTDAKATIEAHNAEVKARLITDYADLKELALAFCATLETMVSMDDPQLAAVKSLVNALKMQMQMQGGQIESFFTAAPVMP